MGRRQDQPSGPAELPACQGERGVRTRRGRQRISEDPPTAVPGILSYVHQLEVGYAVHELVFGVLLIAIIAIPLRQRQRWAWFACWTILIADITYAATFGVHDPTILRESLIGAIGMPALLLALTPSVFRRSTEPDKAAALPTA